MSKRFAVYYMNDAGVQFFRSYKTRKEAMQEAIRLNGIVMESLSTEVKNISAMLLNMGKWYKLTKDADQQKVCHIYRLLKDIADDLEDLESKGLIECHND